MTPELWRDIKAVLQEALDLGPSQRLAFLDACQPAIREEVESLIRSYDENSSFLEERWLGEPPVSAQSTSGMTGKRFGPYRVMSLLGHGGMGSVWLAERADGLFTRRVALKLIHPALADWVMTERLAREREILANLNHPNIARLLDAGFGEDGQPYLALEYVNGTPLTTYCDNHHLPIRERLELFRQVLSAVQYAHAHLIVHRDLKPSNILVTPEGQVQLLDFGIAKLLTEGEAKETQLTKLGGRALTPDYAAPEQILGAPITTVADVYALGVLLYEILTGSRPYRLRRDTRGALEEAIIQAEPTVPSRLAVSEAAAQARSSTGRRLAKTLSGDLDAITSKALKKSPADRYATADAFGEDIARFLRGEGVFAQHDSLAYQAFKFAKRHWVAMAVVSALVLTLAGGLAATTHEAAVASALRDVALQAQGRALTQTAAARLRDTDIAGALGIILDVLPHAGVSPHAELKRSYTTEALSVFQEARAADTEVVRITGHTDVVQTAAFSSDGLRIVTASEDKTVRIWDTATGLQLMLLSGHTRRVPSAAFSPDGTRIVTASLDKTVRIWDAATGRQIVLLSGHTGGVWSATFSPDGRRIVTASSDKTARVWDVSTGQQIALLTGHADRVWSAAFSPDGQRIVTASFDKSARVWDAGTGKQIMVLSGHTDFVASAKFSPDGQRIVTASLDKTARVWDSVTGQQLMLLSGHTADLMSVAFSPDGGRIVTASLDKSARVWDAATGQQLVVLGGHGGRMTSAAFSPDGGHIITSSYDNIACLWDAVTGQQEMLLTGHTARVWSAAISPDGRRVVTTSLDKTARIWDATTGQQLKLLSGHTNLVASAAFSPDGRRIVTSSNDATARIWDAETGQQIGLITGQARMWSATFSPDGRRVVTASDDMIARIWDAETGRQIEVLSGHTGRVLSAAFAPDGQRIVTSSLDRTARIWESATGRELMQLTGHEDVVEYASFSPDGRRIVTASDDKTARIWDAATARELIQLRGHEDVVQDAHFSADGGRVVTASADKTARIWDAATGHQIKVLGGLTDLVATAVFSPDGKRVVTASGMTARIWDASTPSLDIQIGWTDAAQFDPLSSEERFRLGLPAAGDVRQWPVNASKCDQSAAAPYDPDRRAAGVVLDKVVSDIALEACAKERSSSDNAARAIYQHGRAAMAKGNLSLAKQDFEAAAARGYRAAKVDLAVVLSQSSSGMQELPRAISLCEQAWNQGVAIAAFELGSLYEHGMVSPSANRGESVLTPDLGRAWSWYRKGANAGEPNALARFGDSESAFALREGNARRDAYLLESFRYYATAVERARRDDWPDDAWRNWRYRRASLARLLARDGMTEQVADVYYGVRNQHPAPAPPLWKQLTSLIGIN